MSAITWQLFDASNKDPDDLKLKDEKEAETGRGAARALLCGRCLYPISSDAQRINIAGAHTHTCTNPHGLVYRIGCFSAAPGCTAVGPAFSEYCWFQGYRWQVGVCSNCHEHLGWLFHGDSPFYGLIHDRLSSAEP